MARHQFSQIINLNKIIDCIENSNFKTFEFYRSLTKNAFFDSFYLAIAYKGKI